MPKIDIPFGLHLMIDQYDCPKNLLNDPGYIYKMLEDLTKKIGMKPLIKPYVVKADGNNKRDPGGWSGFIIIQESHISIHTFVEKKFLTADVYSCKHFESKVAIDFFKKVFKSNKLEINEVVRGKKYPK